MLLIGTDSRKVGGYQRGNHQP